MKPIIGKLFFFSKFIFEKKKRQEESRLSLVLNDTNGNTENQLINLVGNLLHSDFYISESKIGSEK